MDIKLLLFSIIICSTLNCIRDDRKKYFCNEFTKKNIKFEIGEGFELINNPDLKNSVGIELYYRNKNFKELHYLYFSTRPDFSYINQMIHSDNNYKKVVELSLKQNQEIDTIYQIRNIKINDLNSVSFTVGKKRMGYNIWVESHCFNLRDSIVLIARTTDFDSINNLFYVEKKHLEFVESIEIGDCNN